MTWKSPQTATPRLQLFFYWDSNPVSITEILEEMGSDLFIFLNPSLQSAAQEVHSVKYLWKKMLMC